MNKKLSILCSLLFVGLSSMSAAPIGKTAAKQIANRFMGHSNQLRMTYAAPMKLKNATEAQRNDFNYYYVFNQGENDGYVIVAGDDRVKPIFGFTDEGHLSAESIQNNPSIRALFEEYERQVDYAVKTLPDKPYSGQLRASSEIEVQRTPLLGYSNDRKTKLREAISWGQDWPFNKYCPNVTYYRRVYPTVSGCVATAISTVLRWHQWPDKAQGTLSYTWNRQRMFLDFDKVGAPENKAYDWANNMPAAVDARGYNRATRKKCTEAEADNIGRLLRDIGYAVKMDYGPASAGGSGTQVYYAVRPLVNNFKYKNTLRWQKRDNFRTKTAWINELKDEMDNYGPVVYAGFSNDGGHCFVLDGYATKGYVHVDWGWNRHENGWFDLDVLEPGSQGIGGSSSGYAYGQQMLRYLQPNRTDNPDPDPTPNPNPDPDPQPEDVGASLYIAEVASQTSVSAEKNQYISVTVGNKNEKQKYSNNLYLVAYNNDQSVVKIVASAFRILYKNSTRPIVFYADFTGFASGDYNLAVAYVNNAGKTTVIPQSAGKVQVRGTNPAPKPQPTPTGYELQVMNGAQVTVDQGTDAKFDITVANNGDVMYDNYLNLYVVDNANRQIKISGGNVKIEKGQRVVVTFYSNDAFQKLQPATYKLMVSHMAADKRETAVVSDKYTNDWRAGSVTINKKADPTPQPVNYDAAQASVEFYQGGYYVGRDYSTINYNKGEFIARVYMKSVNGFDGEAYFFISTSRSGGAVDKAHQIVLSINLKADTKGYIDIKFPTYGLNGSMYYINTGFKPKGADSFKFVPNNGVGFYLSRSSFWTPAPTPNEGPTVDPTDMPSKYQTVGAPVYTEEIKGGNVTSNQEVELQSSETYLFPTEAENEVTIVAPEAGIATVFDMTGRQVMQINVVNGKTAADVSALMPGIYMIKVGHMALRFVKK